MTEQPLMTADEVAREFQITSTQVLTLARRGEIPCVRLGRWVRFSREHLDEVKARRSPANVANDGSRSAVIQAHTERVVMATRVPA